MIKKRLYYFIVCLLCVTLIFAGCENSPEEPPLESLLSQEHETNSELEEPESGKMTETEASEAEIIESEESSSTGEVQGDALTYIHPYDNLAYYTGVLVRWGSVIGDRFHPYFPDFFRTPSNYQDMSKLFMVNVEVLDVVDHTALHEGRIQIDDLDKIFLPREALDDIVEGEEALVFIDVLSYAHKQEEWGLIGVIYPLVSPERPLPIFQYENGRMLIDEAQMMMNVPTSENCDLYAMPFLARTQLTNHDLRKNGVDEKYCFRNGMTIEELEQHYDQVSRLPWPYEK